MLLYVFSDVLHIPPYSCPLSLVAFVLLYLLNPFHVLHYRARRWLLRLMVCSVLLYSFLLSSVKHKAAKHGSHSLSSIFSLPQEINLLLRVLGLLLNFQESKRYCSFVNFALNNYRDETHTQQQTTCAVPLSNGSMCKLTRQMEPKPMPFITLFTTV